MQKSIQISGEGAIRDFIKANRLGGMGGFEYQRKYFFHPIIGGLGLREWGGIMADYMNSIPGGGKYSYVDFARLGSGDKISSPFMKAKGKCENMQLF